MFTPESKVGLFVVVAIGLLFVMVNMIHPLNLFRDDDSYSIITFFDSTSGVEEKSLVRVAGVPVGKVFDVRLEENNRAKVTIRLNKGVIIRDDAQATIRAQGLLGEKFIEISSGTSNRSILKDGDVLAHTKTPLDIDEAVGKVGEVLEDLRAVTKSFKEVFGTNEAQIGLQRVFDNIKSISDNLNEMTAQNKERVNRILANLEKVSGTLSKNRIIFSKTLRNFESISRKVDQKIPNILDNTEKVTSSLNDILDEENKKNIKTVLASLGKASEKLDSALTSMNQLLDEGNKENFKEILSNVRQASLKLEETVKNINEISGQIKDGKGTVGKLVSEEEVYDKLNNTLEGINSFVNKAERLKVFVGLRGEYQTDEGGTKSFFSLKLKPREDRYYLLEVTNDERKTKIDDTTNNLDDLLFTFQFSKRYSDAGLRIGLMESSFGVGADLFLADDIFQLKLDAFNFGGYNNTVSNAQLKFTSQLNFYKYLFVYAGMDELLNRKYRTFFGGAGIVFDDDDLKTILAALR